MQPINTPTGSFSQDHGEGVLIHILLTVFLIPESGTQLPLTGLLFRLPVYYNMEQSMTLRTSTIIH